MNALIVYDSQFGNTKRLAEAMTEALHAHGHAQSIHVNATHVRSLIDIDLLVVGSPTQGWRATPGVRAMLAKLPSRRLRGVAVACFDTRFRQPRWLTGSAAKSMSRAFGAMGIPLIAPPESFFVRGKEGPLFAGEIERAAAWAKQLIDAMQRSEGTLRKRAFL